MRDDDRDDPFEDFFRELERMMNEMMGGDVDMNVDVESGGPAGPAGPAGFGADTHVDVHETDEELRVSGPAGFGADTHVDVHETDEELRVVADLPGVAREDIELRCDGEVLSISAANDARDYDERVRLPARVDERSASASYNNGVLEVVLQRVDGATDIDVS